jgi:hypothetical protein
MHLAAIFRHPPQHRLLEVKLLFDHPEGVLHFGSDGSLACSNQVEHSVLCGLPQHATFPWPHSTRNLICLPSISCRVSSGIRVGKAGVLLWIHSWGIGTQSCQSTDAKAPPVLHLGQKLLAFGLLFGSALLVIPKTQLFAANQLSAWQRSEHYSRKVWAGFP